jgi:hypothetical protein
MYQYDLLRKSVELFPPKISESKVYSRFQFLIMLRFRIWIVRFNGQNTLLSVLDDYDRIQNSAAAQSGEYHCQEL